MRWLVFLAFAPQLAWAHCTGEAIFDHATYKVEIVADDESRKLGLMNRDELDTDAGMIFIFPSDGQRNFWMRNTRIPLDILYYSADGVLRATAENAVPYDETGLPGFGSLVLEINAGQYAKAPEDFAMIKGYRFDESSPDCNALVREHPLGLINEPILTQ